MCSTLIFTWQKGDEMAFFEDYIVPDADEYGVEKQPDRPTISAQELKKTFDKLARMAIDAHNALCLFLGEDDALAAYNIRTVDGSVVDLKTFLTSLTAQNGAANLGSLDYDGNYINLQEAMNRLRDYVNSTKITAVVPTGGLTAGMIADGAITTDKIKDAAVTTDKIADYAVTRSVIADNAVAADKIRDAAVTSSKIADGAVTTDKISFGAVARDNITSDLALKIPSVPWDGYINDDDASWVLVLSRKDGTDKIRYRKIPTDILDRIDNGAVVCDNANDWDYMLHPKTSFFFASGGFDLGDQSLGTGKISKAFSVPLPFAIDDDLKASITVAFGKPENTYGGVAIHDYWAADGRLYFRLERVENSFSGYANIAFTAIISGHKQ